MFGTNLTSIGSESIVRWVLGGNFDIGVFEVRLDRRDLKVNGGDDNVDFVGIILEIVNSFGNERHCLLEGVVWFPVAADQ